MRRHHSLTFGLSALVLLAAATHVLPDGEPRALPRLAGSASEPLAVRSGAEVSFEIHGQDFDFDPQGRKIPDQLYLALGRNDALDPRSIEIRETRSAGGQPAGRATWIIKGKAARVTEARFAPVTILLWDGRDKADPKGDFPLAFAQTLHLQP